MKILYWLNGSGGQRTERVLANWPMVTPKNLASFSSQIEDNLHEWMESLDCNSEYMRWGWTENWTEKNGKYEPVDS